MTTNLCVWCREPATGIGIDIIGRSEPLGLGGVNALCDYCQQVNDYLWDVSLTIAVYQAAAAKAVTA
ncbi:hypothetical protein IU418_26455 [Nocardia farcinica]|uniref:hypothetical protein n=1 Tax=Nocardia farcinica TaxID=37329 RepID=UPI001B3C6E07|nr:hypothetical protein [Nocardia farcinica]MBF6540753.1 hypothetical protein [Nocardia farcinica]